MIDKLTYLQGNSFDPYTNLAIEECLLTHVQPNEVILYLWQNKHTVVLGRNQNAMRECKVSDLERSGGKLARRLSGGGAVYHDWGNLNFTFIAQIGNYSVERQLNVIIHALNKLGINATVTGRNDIHVDDRKVSGNAFYRNGDLCYHHGTLMVDVDTDKLSHYLNVSPLKLQSKGVQSVKSRVGNLKDYAQDLTIAVLAAEIKQSFAELYGSRIEDKRFSECEISEISRIRERIASPEWKYGKEIKYTHTVESIMPWGITSIDMDVEHGKIVHACVYTDSLDTEVAQEIALAITGMWHKEVVDAIESGDFSKIR